MTPTLDALYLALDILLAATLAALLTRFWTRNRLAGTIENLEDRHVRFGEGLALLVAGFALLLPGTLLRSIVDGGVLDLVTVAAYLAFFAGSYRCYSATFPDGTPHRAGGRTRT